MVEVANPTLSVRRQGELLGLNRSSYYYQAAPASALNLQLMRLVDEQFLRTPFSTAKANIASAIFCASSRETSL